jgi:hypothetical protein
MISPLWLKQNYNPRIKILKDRVSPELRKELKSEIAKLKKQVERLREAGDKIYKIHQGDLGDYMFDELLTVSAIIKNRADEQLEILAEADEMIQKLEAFDPKPLKKIADEKAKQKKAEKAFEKKKDRLHNF